METAALLALFRSQTRDEQFPYLWSDAEVLSYISAAQEMFCRMTHGIADSTSAVAVLDVAADTEEVSISPQVLRVRNARWGDDVYLTLLNPEDVELGGPLVDDYGISGRRGIDLTETGTPRYLILGMDHEYARLVPIPDTAGTLTMTVQRLPNEIESTGDDLEIHAQHHRYLLLWAQHLAHLKQDAEAYDRGRSEAFREEFVQYCELARRERERREHKYRTVGYGGI